MTAIFDMQISWFSNFSKIIHQRVFRKKIAKFGWILATGELSRRSWICKLVHGCHLGYIYGQSPRLQESCDPSIVLVCSDLHLCLTSFIIELMHRPFRKCIHVVIHSLDKKNCAFHHWNAIKMTFLSCRQPKFLFYTGYCSWVGAVFGR